MSNVSDDQASQDWYAVRLVLLRTDAKDRIDLEPGEQVYEETIRLVKATDHDDCLAVAERLIEAEAKEYGYFTYTGYAEGFKLFDDLENGAEVYTTLRKSTLPAPEYIKKYIRTGQEIGFANEFDSPEN